MRRLLLIPLLALAVACGEDHDPGDHVLDGNAGGNAAESADEHAGGHVHSAPRGGALVVLAEETAHVEVLLDPATGRLSLYVLGPHAETPVRVEQAQIELTLTIAGAEHAVTLPAVGSELTGETLGDTSEFSAHVEALKGVEAFTGKIEQISARGGSYTAVEFTYP